MKKILILLVLILTLIKAQAQWEPDVRLTNDAAMSRTTASRGYCLASQGDTLHVVWYDSRDGNEEIYYKRSTDSGNNWEPDMRLTNALGSSRIPSLTIYASTIYLVWSDDRDGNYEIYYKKSIDGGSNWSSDLRLTESPFMTTYPILSVKGLEMFIIYTEAEGIDYAIFYKRSTDGGLNWGDSVEFTDVYSFSNNASIASDNSNLYVAWNDMRDGNGEIYFKSTTDFGASWIADKRLTNNSATSGQPQLALSSGILYLFWVDARDGGSEIYFSSSSDYGLTWQPDRRLTFANDNSWYQKVAAHGKNLYLVWQDNRNANDEIFYMFSKDGGTTWSEEMLLSNNNVTMSELPSIALTDSMIHIVWTDKRDGPNGDIYYKRNPTGNVVSVEDNKSLNNLFNIYPNPATDDIYIQNTENQTGNIEIYNVLGNKVLISEFKEKVDVSKLPEGMYYLVINKGKKIESTNFMIIR
ncbi:MAG: T9SS type A sorting domain-containing protein [bacterium]